MYKFRSYIDTNHPIHTRNLLFPGRAKGREGSLQSGPGHGLPDGVLVLDISWVFVRSPRIDLQAKLDIRARNYIYAGCRPPRTL